MNSQLLIDTAKTLVADDKGLLVKEWVYSVQSIHPTSPKNATSVNVAQ